MNKSTEIFNIGLEDLELKLNDNQIKQFYEYYDLLVEKNKVMNLTSITEFDEVIIKHFIDSLACVKGIDFKEINTVIDIGTGAGFPGIPLKISFPHLSVTLLDSLNKRIGFLNEVIYKLELSNVLTLHGRAEDIANKPEHRESYDLCVSRAVANYSVLLEYCLPFVKVGGYFISYKSSNINEELEESGKALHVLGGELIDVVKFNLPTTEIGRTLLIAKKIRKTPKQYPRKAGLPDKSPIKSKKR